MRAEPGRLTQEWLSPSNEPSGSKKIQKIKDPILLLHNRDDNNVNIKVTLDWYNQAHQLVENGKNLIRLYITRIGNSDTTWERTGHFLPTNKEAFEAYAQTVLSFMTEKASNIPAISEWRAQHEEMLANKNYRSATLEEKFLSLAYRLYQATSNRLYKQAVDTHTPSSAIGTPAGIIVKGQKRGSWTEQQQEAWNKFYVPILYIVSLDDEANLKQILSPEILTNTHLENGLKQQLPLYLEYFKARYNLEIPNSLDVNSLAKNKNLQSLYKDYLTEPGMHGQFDPSGYSFNKDFASYLLYTLYLGNLDQKDFTLPFPNDFKEKWKDKLEDLKEKLIQTIEEGAMRTKTVWQQVAKAKLAKKAD